MNAVILIIFYLALTYLAYDSFMYARWVQVKAGRKRSTEHDVAIVSACSVCAACLAAMIYLALFNPFPL